MFSEVDSVAGEPSNGETLCSSLVDMLGGLWFRKLKEEDPASGPLPNTGEEEREEDGIESA